MALLNVGGSGGGGGFSFDNLATFLGIDNSGYFPSFASCGIEGTFDATAAEALTCLDVQSNTIDELLIPDTIVKLNANDNSLPAAEVDRLLKQLVDAGLANGAVYIATNEAPSAIADITFAGGDLDGATLVAIPGTLNDYRPVWHTDAFSGVDLGWNGVLNQWEIWGGGFGVGTLLCHLADTGDDTDLPAGLYVADDVLTPPTASGGANWLTAGASCAALLVASGWTVNTD
jgi:hypothetical protein